MEEFIYNLTKTSNKLLLNQAYEIYDFDYHRPSIAYVGI